MFARHRRDLMDRMRDAVAVVFAAPEAIRNNDVHHEYRQDSDFYFLTGFDEPEAVLVLAPGRDKGDQTALFLRAKDLESEVWDGRRLGADAAPDALGVDKAYPIGELSEKLLDYFEGVQRIYYAHGQDAAADLIVSDALQRVRRRRKEGKTTPSDILHTESVLHETRLIKPDEDLETMRRAAALTTRGHLRAMAVTRPGRYEYEIQAAMEYEWRVRGAHRNAYPSIVGSGPNACVLHYNDNNRRMRAGELLLVDAGCELDYFASDVTRTWPIDGRFTPAQRAVYEVVLGAQRAAIDMCRPGHTFDRVHRTALRHLVEGICELGLLKGDVDTLIEEEKFKRYYMHRTGHWIGMDVHDVGAYHLGGTSRALEPGMVLTVEPGLYISPTDEEAPERLRGIGIRIEDDVCITAGAPEVLTAEIPKAVDDVEAMVGTADL